VPHPRAVPPLTQTGPLLFPYCERNYIGSETIVTAGVDTHTDVHVATVRVERAG
jgi:hypothetical protein